MVVKPLRHKSDATDALITILNQLEAAVNLHTKEIHADWGGEFRNVTLQEQLRQRGTILKETALRNQFHY